jgi:predicted enzyme related to lactoylglutathione lyase
VSISASVVRRLDDGRNADREATQGVFVMPHPVIHVEIRTADPDATRAFFADLFDWKYSDGEFPGYTFADTGVPDAIPTAIGPLQGGDDNVLFFVGVQDVGATLKRAEDLGGSTVQPAVDVPGVTFGAFADPQGHVIGVAATS